MLALMASVERLGVMLETIFAFVAFNEFYA
jgi:hypothetical protein